MTQFNALPDSETSAHPMAGTVIDEIIAQERAGNYATAEATKLAAQAAFLSDIAAWKRQAAEDAGRGYSNAT